ncbi:LAGLIDADG family homing endonuclease [Halobacillus sp. BBL2006]|uniref:LAGLIDADG family homing endonuclease n=1 Tax=Halobacillus sp. BBL2006 TaxID=1543706 RepID=UPI00068F0678|nr:LAGLIDADG family homing endonuclease [Halobacillus sp. BBL2006]
MRKRVLTDQEVIELYQNGERTAEIAEKANVSARLINSVLRKHNVERRPKGSWRRKYEVNEHYFRTWSNNMAYILGFFAADGNIPKETQLVSFAQKEFSILEDIKNELESSHPIRRNEKIGVHLLTINSKIMRTDLIELHGLQPNKSLKLKFPHIPPNHISHFVRGYFDGDGYVNYQKKQVCIVCGSQEFLDALQSLINMKGIKSSLATTKSYSRIYINGRKSIKQFADWIYSDSDLFLSRKL